jgi:hypothetical protein
VGALISTSAEAVTYEWSELQSGIFSYEVRSGLRGAADVDGDGRVSYRELSAFIRTVNAPVKNELYRPRVYARAPEGDADEPLLQLPASGRRLHLPAAGGRRLTLRDAQGVRVLDVHKEDATGLSLFLPDALGTLGIFEEVHPAVASAGARPEVRYRSFPLGADLRLELAPSEPSPLVARGDAPVFRSLFEQPFGQQALAAQGGVALVEEPAQSFGITQRDAERLEVHLESAAAMGRDARVVGGMALLSMGATLGLLSIPVMQEAPPEARDALLITTLGGGALLGASALAAWLLPSDEERLLESFRKGDVSTESSRAQLVLESERRFEQHAQQMRTLRHASAGVLGGMGVLGLGASAVAAISSAELGGQEQRDLRTLALFAGGTGLLGIAQAIYFGFFYRYPLERAWERYTSDPDVREHRPQKEGVQVNVTAGPMGRQGFGLGLTGSF